MDQWLAQFKPTTVKTTMHVPAMKMAEKVELGKQMKKREQEKAIPANTTIFPQLESPLKVECSMTPRNIWKRWKRE